MRYPLGFVLALSAAWVCPAPLAAGEKITGSNGVEIEFVAIFEATPKGMVALADPKGAGMVVPWEKIDLDKLKANQPVLYDAYVTAAATDKSQHIGYGLAEKILTPDQARAAIRQALTDPNGYWGWGYSYQSLRTTASSSERSISVSGNGTPESPLVINSRGRSTTRNTGGVALTKAPNQVFQNLVSATSDQNIRDAFYRLKASKGLMEAMLARLDFVFERLCPERIFPRSGADKNLYQETEKLRKNVRAWIDADNFSADNQRFLRDYLRLLDLK
jgi:hypothetical protein